MDQDQPVNLRAIRSLMHRLAPVVHAKKDWDLINPELAEKYKELYEPLPGETGWDRVKMIFELDEWGQKHPNLDFTFQGVMMGFFVGSAVGGFQAAKQATDQFIQRNEAAKFYTDLDAKRRLNDHVFYSAYRSAFKWGWRTSLFTGVYLFSLTFFSTYQNSTKISHYVGAGALTGTLFKFRMGPRAMLVGGGLGSVLGLIAGGLTTGMFWVMGSSLDEMNYWRLQYRISQQSEVYGTMLKKRKDSLDPSLLANDLKVNAEKTKADDVKTTSPKTEAA